MKHYFLFLFFTINFFSYSQDNNIFYVSFDYLEEEIRHSINLEAKTKFSSELNSDVTKYYMSITKNNDTKNSKEIIITKEDFEKIKNALLEITSKDIFINNSLGEEVPFTSEILIRMGSNENERNIRMSNIDKNNPIFQNNNVLISARLILNLAKITVEKIN